MAALRSKTKKNLTTNYLSYFAQRGSVEKYFDNFIGGALIICSNN